MNKTKKKEKVSLMNRFILGTERIGNKIPHPLSMFMIFAAMIFVISIFTANIEIPIPGTDIVVVTRSLANADFIREFLKDLPVTYITFAPIKLVIIMVFGISVCDHTGLFETSIKRALKNVPSTLLTVILVTLAVNGNLAGDAIDVFLPAIAAVIFLAKGRNPMIGMITAFACAGGGYNASFLIGSADAIIAGMTESAQQILPSIANYTSHVAMNYYFNFASAILLIPVGVLVTEKIIAPIIDGNKEYQIDEDFDYEKGQNDSTAEVSATEQKGLKYAGISLLIYVAIILLVTLPQGSLLRNPETGLIVPRSPFMDSIPTLLAMMFFVPGVVYGTVIKKIRGVKDVADMIAKGISSMSPFLVMVFGAAIFSQFFKYTNLATLIAFKGTDLLQAINLSGIPMIVAVILLFGFLNLFMISTSAKWAILAPIFVPLLALMGYSPAFAQAIYRIGNSSTNIISPLNTSLPIILGIMSQYKKDTGIGTVISLALPYSIAFMIIWTLLAIVFMLFNLPIGPGSYILL